VALVLGDTLFLGNDLPRAPVGRTLAMLLIGAVAAVWALASLTR